MNQSKNSNTLNKPSIVIIGIGNVLCSDEGIGVHVINELKRITLPPNVKVFDCGTSGMAILEAMDGAEKAIIIDAISSGKEPGTIHIYSIEELLRMEDNLLKLVSLHQLNLISTFKLAKLTDAYRMPPQIIIIGIEIESLEYSLKLSDKVTKVIPKVIEMIIHKIEGVSI